MVVISLLKWLSLIKIEMIFEHAMRPNTVYCGVTHYNNLSLTTLLEFMSVFAYQIS